jgi:hypothetical protein
MTNTGSAIACRTARIARPAEACSLAHIAAITVVFA